MWQQLWTGRENQRYRYNENRHIVFSILEGGLPQYVKTIVDLQISSLNGEKKYKLNNNIIIVKVIKSKIIYIKNNLQSNMR